MKNIIVALLTLTFFTTLLMTASARDRGLTGTIRVGNGDEIIRISVGGDDDRDAMSMARRVKRLEAAVRSLQNRVYDLEDRGSQVDVWTCSVEAFGTVFYNDEDKSATKGQASKSAVENCTEKFHSMHCGEIKCSKE